jgi:hypothetical protein
MGDELTRGQRLANLAGAAAPPAAAECGCGLPIEPPGEVQHWHPDRDPEPAGVDAVARYGQPPGLRRAVRVAGGWAEVGSLVGFYGDRTPPMRWAEVGECWAGTRHPVVAVETA